ncbi:MAG: radical SAM protein [Oscillospiraceae bacterium]|nr:radical SAM protein [Oscillospiraceae bacterium]
MAIPTIPAKTILSAYQEHGWLGMNYNINLYRGCCHGCIYCDSRSDCYGTEDFDTVRVKADALAILEQELRARRRTGTVMLGAMSDPYNPHEKQLEVTRGALKLFARYGYGVSLVTKSALVTRDIDVLRDIAEHAPAAVSLTITAAEDDLCRKIEPHVNPSSARFAALAALSSAGIRAGVTLMPLLPFISDSEENMLAIVNRAHACGAQWIHAYGGFGVTLRQNQRAYFLTQAERLFPGVRRRYEETYGYRYQCGIPDQARIWKSFSAACQRLGIPYKSGDVGRLITEGYGDGQMRLF